MSDKVKRQKIAKRFPHEETWLRRFVGFHGVDAVTRFCEDDLRGVSLVEVLEALAQGSVINAEKCDGPGTICDVERRQENGSVVAVSVYFASNEEVLTIRGAEVVREPENETDNAA